MASRGLPLLICAFGLAAQIPPASAPPTSASSILLNLSDRLRDGRNGWEQAIQRGDGAFVRKALEGLLEREGAAVNPSDYNEMHALVAIRNLAAQACVVEGAWEDAVTHLQRASTAAADNAANADQTLVRIRKQHLEKLAEWKEALPKQEQRLQSLEAQPGLSDAQMKTRSQLRAYLDEHRNAVAHSERALRAIDEIVAQLKLDQETYSKSAAEWHGFLAKEKIEISQAGSAARYAAEKLEQVKADDARPRFERIAYGRRLLRLDPANPDTRRFVNGLLGISDPEPPKPAPKKKAKQPAK